MQSESDEVELGLVLQLLVELPYKDSDCVDLTGDAGAVGRLTFCEKSKLNNKEGAGTLPAPGQNEPTGKVEDEAGPSSGKKPAVKEEAPETEMETEEALVLDLKGVKFDAQIAALNGTALMLNIAPTGGKVLSSARD